MLIKYTRNKSENEKSANLFKTHRVTHCYMTFDYAVLLTTSHPHPKSNGVSLNRRRGISPSVLYTGSKAALLKITSIFKYVTSLFTNVINIIKVTPQSVKNIKFISVFVFYFLQNTNPIYKPSTTKHTNPMYGKTVQMHMQKPEKPENGEELPLKE